MAEVVGQQKRKRQPLIASPTNRGWAVNYRCGFFPGKYIYSTPVYGEYTPPTFIPGPNYSPLLDDSCNYILREGRCFGLHHYLVERQPFDDDTLASPVEVDVPADDESDKRARIAGADDDTLRRLMPEVAAAPRSGHDDECAICLQNLQVEEDDAATPITRTMPCSHAFHESCIFKWIRQNRACPICRRSLPTLQQMEYDYHDDDWLQLTMPVPREMLEVEVLL